MPASGDRQRRPPTWTALVGSCTRTWIRAGADSADLEREKFECQFEASKSLPPERTLQLPRQGEVSWKACVHDGEGMVETLTRTAIQSAFRSVAIRRQLSELDWRRRVPSSKGNATSP
jgi:hypothetical protein